MIYLDFKIHRKYLINFLLANTNNFSCEKYQNDIITFQNLAREKSSSIYKFLTGRTTPTDLTKKKLDYILTNLTKYYYELENKEVFQKLYHQTKEYKKFCKSQRKKILKKVIVLLKTSYDFLHKENIQFISPILV